MKELLADILVPRVESIYSYRLAIADSERFKVGQRIKLEFGHQKTLAYILKIYPETAEVQKRFEKIKLKTVTWDEFNHLAFLPEQLSFFNWICDYYQINLSDVIDLAVPAYVAPRSEKFIQLLNPEYKSKGSKQAAILELLQKLNGRTSLGTISSKILNPSASLKKLQELGVIRVDAKLRTENYEHEVPVWAHNSVALNSEQIHCYQEVLSDIEKSQSNCYLIQGVTGSGKTEVYIELVNKIIADGKSALIVVPEIALTPQVIDRFAARLGGELAVLHSGLSPRERWTHWESLLNGKIKIAIGARSAIFAGMHNLGIIIVDEEHDSSYKQSEGIRYNARDLAVVLGKINKCPVVLGSATPALETYHNARTGKYKHLTIGIRYGDSPGTSYEIIDLSTRKPWEMPSKHLSPELYQALSENLNTGQQSFVLFNRRGFANYYLCDRCNEPAVCKNCDVTLTYHKVIDRLICHYCDFQQKPPEFCKECADTGQVAKMYMKGAGTEQVVEELYKLFPDAKILRMDRDTAKNVKEFRSIIDQVRNGEASILVGTQMIAKGHDLPGVTLVGIVDCDIGLHFPDFRASERVFQLLTQAGGRAGRRELPGRVILQTRIPKNPAILATLNKSYENFAISELRSRKNHSYPPYSKLLRVIVSAAEQHEAIRTLKMMSEYLKKYLEKNNLDLSVLGPVSAPLNRLRNMYREHLIIKSNNASQLTLVIRLLKQTKFPKTKVKIYFDLDPQDLL